MNRLQCWLLGFKKVDSLFFEGKKSKCKKKRKKNISTNFNDDGLCARGKNRNKINFNKHNKNKVMYANTKGCT